MQKRGFTLIELLVVIAIISLLASIILASLGQSRTKATISATNSAVLQYRNALELYAADNGGLYPSALIWYCVGLYTGIYTSNGCGVASTASGPAAFSSLGGGTYNPTFNTKMANYISSLPPVSTKVFTHDGTNYWLGATYKCITSAPGFCKVAEVDWYLPGTNQTCISGATVDPNYNNANLSTKCSLTLGS